MEGDRQFSEQSWKNEMRKRAERGELEPFNDLVTKEEYKKALEEHFGSLDSLKGKHYLDVGVGFGSGLHDLLQEHGVEITNLDISHDALKHLKKKTPQEPGVVGTAYALPFKDGSFDGVVSLNLINTSAGMDLWDVKDIFSEASRILKPGGDFIQSHFGYAATSVSRDKQLGALKLAGFDREPRLIENDMTRMLSFMEPLSFIAKKS